MAKRNKKKSKRSKKPKARKRSRSKPSTTKKGLAFEHRAARAISQIKPELDVHHNERLTTEPGHLRQFDVVAWSNGFVTSTYEARDHERRVDTGQIEAFETKNATLKEKPQVAGIISAQGFWKPPIEWVRHYLDPQHEPKFVQELFHLRRATAADWKQNRPAATAEVDARSLRTLPVRIVYGDTLPAANAREVTLTSDRSSSYIRDEQGHILGNLIDIVNREIRRALSSEDIAPRVVELPANAFLTIGACTRQVTGLELAFEEISIPAVTTIDLSGRYPDTLIDVLADRQWLIEDQTAALKASRSGINVTLAFPDTDDDFVNLDELPEPPEVGGSGVPSGLSAHAAAVSLHAALDSIRENKSVEDIPQDLLDLTWSIRDAVQRSDWEAAEQLSKQSLALGTALDALCVLGYLASKRGKHQEALAYSLQAAKLSPLEPQGFANAVACLLAMKDFTGARRVVGAARVLHGVSASMRRQEADLLYFEDRFRESAEKFYELFLDNENDASLLMNFARCEQALGDQDGAAWDAFRAAQLAPANATLIGLAATYAEVAGQASRVLELATMHRAEAGELDIRIVRQAVNASLAQGDPTRARQWLDCVDRSLWGALDFAAYAQLRAVTETGSGALDDVRRALDAPDISDDIRVRVAETALRLGSAADALRACSDCKDSRIPRLWAIANSMLGRTDEALTCIGSLPTEEANRIVVECMQRCSNESGDAPAALEKLSDWLRGRESEDPSVLKCQVWLTATNACKHRDAKEGAKALHVIQRLRAITSDTSDVIPVEALALVACGRIPDAETALRTNVMTSPSDILAVAALVAMEGSAPSVAFEFAKAASQSGNAPVTRYSPHQLQTTYLLSAIASQQRIEEIRKIAARAPLSPDRQGLLAKALIAYVDERLDDAIRDTSPLIGPNGTMVEAFLLRAQCLAEKGALVELASHITPHFPSLAALMVWAAERAAGSFDAGLLPAVAVQFAMSITPEFAGVARKGHLCLVTAGSDWASALKGAFENCPDADAVWVARLGHPATYLRTLLTQRPNS